LADEGLKSNVVGLFGGTMLGISSVAPAYALTVTLGILASSVGARTPAVIIAGFLPITLRDSADPSYGSGASIGGIGLVLLLGLGLILVGLVFMAIMRVRQPAFFRGETLKHESAHAMRPHEHLVS
jgi:hypothetical protein